MVVLDGWRGRDPFTSLSINCIQPLGRRRIRLDQIRRGMLSDI